MKIPTLILATGAAAVLAVPMASATADRSLPWDTNGQTSHQQLSKKLTTTAGKAKVTTARRVVPGVIFIYVPMPPLSTMPYVDCASSANNCTTQEFCDFWGDGCHAPAPDTTALRATATAATP